MSRCSLSASLVVTGCLLMASGCSKPEIGREPTFSETWYGHVGIWVVGLILPAAVVYIANAFDHEEKDRIKHYDSSGRETGYTELPTGRIIEGSHEKGMGCATVWVVGYLGYWIFYGWWH